MENFSWSQCRDLAANEAPAALWLAESDGGEGKLTKGEPRQQRDPRARDEWMMRKENKKEGETVAGTKAYGELINLYIC